MDLSELRGQIDALDEELLRLFLRRMALAEAIGRKKAESGAPVSVPRREEEILARVKSASGELAPYAEELFKTLFRLSRERQKELLPPET